MVASVEAAVCGPGLLQPLVDDAGVADILVNAPDAIFAERVGRLERTEITLASDRRSSTRVHGVFHLNPVGYE